MIGNFGISKILLFHYEMGKFSSEWHHSFFLDLRPPNWFPPFYFLKSLARARKIKKELQKALVVSSNFELSKWLYTLVGVVNATFRLWFFHIWLIVIIDLCYESFDHWNLLNHVILCDTKLLLSWTIVRRMVYEQYRGVLARSFH